MLWLAEQGYGGTGIELSERAARDFFTGNHLPFERVHKADSVTETEVGKLFSTAFTIECLLQEERLSKEPRFREKGLTRMEETVYLLRRTGAQISNP